MFENIIGLSRVCDDLRRDITTGTLPGSILISGPRYGGKSSVALETARVITCTEKGLWNCTCRSCSMHRALQHPNTLMLGPRYFSQEIAAALAAFRRENRSGTRFLVVRSVRKLIRRFEPLVWPENRIKSALPVAENLESTLADFDAAAEEDASSLPSILGKIEKESIRLEQLLPHDSVPVDVIRAVSGWSHLMSSGGRQVVIIEEAHTLQEGARNGMLKILEEPPVNTTFILTSSRKTALIPTIRSRLRAYELPERREEDQQAVQRRIFRLETPAERLREFFRDQTGVDGDSWPTISRELVDHIEEGRPTHSIERRLKDRIAATSPRHGAEYFLDSLEEEIRLRLRENAGGVVTRRVLFNWSALVRRYWSRIDTRNMSPQSVLPALILALKKTVEKVES